MSVEAITWAMERSFDVYWEKPLRSGPKLLLVVIANSADPYGIAFPGRGLLAQRCCCDDATVSRNLRKLEDSALIARLHRRRGNGSRTSDWVVLAPQWAPDARLPLRDASEGPWPAEVRALARALDVEPAAAETDELAFLDDDESSHDETPPDDSSRDESCRSQVAFCGGPEPSEEPSETVANATVARATRNRDEECS